MSKLEIIILIIVCALPVVALILILPKHLKKKKKTPPPTTDYVPDDESLKPTEEKPAEPAPVIEKEVPSPKIDEDEFKDYLKNRRPRNNPQPFMPPRPPFFDDDFMPQQSRPPQKSKNKLLNEVDGLSDELKTLLITGALDKKFDYDDFGNPDKSNDGPSVSDLLDDDDDKDKG